MFKCIRSDHCVNKYRFVSFIWKLPCIPIIGADIICVFQMIFQIIIFINKHVSVKIGIALFLLCVQDHIKNYIIIYKIFMNIMEKLSSKIINNSSYIEISALHFKKLISIFKCGEKVEATNYKGVSIISNVANIFKHAVKNRLISFLQKYIIHVANWYHKNRLVML